MKTDTHWLFWSWNPNLGGHAGTTANDWSTIDDRKMQKLKHDLKLAADRDTNAPQPETPQETQSSRVTRRTFFL